MELIIEGSERRFRRNLGNAIVERSGNSITRRYVYTDHLGSVDVITNAAGQLLEKLSFDAFGKRRAVFTSAGQSIALNLSTLLAITHQGFTGHQQVDHAGIVQMGGRIYDSHIGRFLQADPFVQSPSNSQNFNRYSYVLNNPLSYTDPSGYLFKKLNKALGKFAPFVAIAIMFIPGGQGVGAAMLKGFIAGGIASGSLRGAVVGAFSAGIGFGGDLGFIGNGMVGGMSSVVMGGKFAHGFLSAGISSQLSPGIQQNVGNSYVRVAMHAIVGGTISKATGGKFANGAYSAAFTEALRQLATPPGLSKAGGPTDGQNAGLDPEVKKKLTELMATDNNAAIKYAAEYLGLDFDGARSVKVDLNRGLYGRIDIHGEITFGRNAFASPEALLSTVGHEWVHLQQWKGQYMHTRGPMHDVNEIQAYQWELDNMHRTGYTAGRRLIEDNMNSHFNNLQRSSDVNDLNSYYWRARRGIYTRIGN